MGKNVFFGLSGGMGPVLRCMSAAEKFRDAGCHVYFSVYGKHEAEMIERLGFTHLEDESKLAPAPQHIVPAGNRFYNLDHYYSQIGLLDESFAAEWIWDRIRMLGNLQADLVIVDQSPHTVIAARYLGIPIVSITQACFHPNGEPIYSWGEPPRNLPKVTPTINNILNRLSLPSIERMEDLSRGDIDLIPSFPEFDPTDGGVIYTGPIEYSLPNDVDSGMDRVWESGEPYILVYPGRLKDSSGYAGGKIVQAVSAAFADKPVRVVIAVQASVEELFASGKPDNVMLIPSFTEEWLEHCRLFVHHGGHGSCLSALVHGIPSLILPTHTEREYNARKAQALGIAEYLMPGTFTAGHMYQLANYVMDDEYADRTRELRNEVLERPYRGAGELFARGMSLLQSSSYAGRG